MKKNAYFYFQLVQFGEEVAVTLWPWLHFRSRVWLADQLLGVSLVIGQLKVATSSPDYDAERLAKSRRLVFSLTEPLWKIHVSGQRRFGRGTPFPHARNAPRALSSLHCSRTV